VRTEIVRTRSRFEQLREEWTALTEAMDGAEIFDTWEWHEASLQALHEPEPALFIVVVYEAERCVAIAPLALVERKIGGVKARVLRPINADSAACHAFCLDRGRNHYALLKRIVAELDDRSDEWDYLELTGVSSKSSAMTLARNLLGVTFASFAEEADVTTYVRSGADDFEAKLSAKEMRDIERRERKLLRELDARIVLDRPYSERLWRRLLELHRRKWAESEVTAGRYGRFLERLLPVLDAKRQVSFSYVEIGGRIEAIVLCLRMNGKMYGEITNYSPEYAKWGIGLVLLKNVLARCREIGVGEFDFKQGAHPYKFYWTDGVRRNFNVYACSNNGKRTYLSLYTWLKLAKRSFAQTVGRRGDKHAANGDSIGRARAQTLGS